jgi:hypothetical protein
MHRAALFILVAGSTGPATAADALDTLVAKDPIVEATKAFAAGNRRHIVVPVCGKEPGEVIPGWPLHDSPRIQEAIKAGQRPVSCADIGADPKHERFMRAAKYAERYNGKLLELEGTK